MSNNFKIEWFDRGREPQCAPNPAYPNGRDVDGAKDLGVPTCHTELPYPAKRCGVYSIQCKICGCTAMITTAGRPDDPRSVDIPCRITTGVQ